VTTSAVVLYCAVHDAIPGRTHRRDHHWRQRSRRAAVGVPPDPPRRGSSPCPGFRTGHRRGRGRLRPRRRRAARAGRSVPTRGSWWHLSLADVRFKTGSVAVTAWLQAAYRTWLALPPFSAQQPPNWRLQTSWTAPRWAPLGAVRGMNPGSVWATSN